MGKAVSAIAGVLIWLASSAFLFGTEAGSWLLQWIGLVLLVLMAVTGIGAILVHLGSLEGAETKNAIPPWGNDADKS